jgi:hypothetical protein
MITTSLLVLINYLLIELSMLSVMIKFQSNSKV